MGELIIHIDQTSGAVTSVKQTLVETDKNAISEKLRNGKFKEENEIPFNIFEALQNSDKEAAEQYEKVVKQHKQVIEEIKKWLGNDDAKSITVELPSMGDLYNDRPEVVKQLKIHRDTFDRIVSLPVELWEKKGNTVCTAKIGGAIRKCHH